MSDKVSGDGRKTRSRSTSPLNDKRNKRSNSQSVRDDSQIDVVATFKVNKRRASKSAVPD